MRALFFFCLAESIVLGLGCGPSIPLSSGAVPCGQVRGFDVYVESPNTCADALALVPATIDRGVSLGLWASSARWAVRLEIVDPEKVGFKGLNGITVPGQMALASPTPWLAGHEFIHARYGQGDHCHWASKYQESIEAFGGGSGGKYLDACENKVCWEGNFWDCDPVKP